MVSISCMQAEKVSLDTSGAQGLLLGSLSFELGLFGGGSGGYSGAQFVAVGGDTGWYSFDGTSDWTAFAFTGSGINVRSVAFGNGTWVAVGNYNDTGCGIWTSPDGVTWTRRDCAGYAPSTIAFGNGRFVANGDYCSSGYISTWTSVDGINWNSHQYYSDCMDDRVASITFEPSTGFFVLKNDIGTSGSTETMWTSADGMTLNDQTSILGFTGEQFTVHRSRTGTVLATGEYGAANPYARSGTINPSTGAITWSPLVQLGVGGQYTAVAGFSGGYLAIMAEDYCTFRTASTLADIDAAPSAGTAPGSLDCESHYYQINQTSLVRNNALNRYVAALHASDFSTEFIWSNDGGQTWNSGASFQSGIGFNYVNVIAAAR